ncbi:hypothetical protein Tco_1345336 [Tanacetum coccineum]
MTRPDEAVFQDDPKDKGKKRIEEDDLTLKSEEINESEKEVLRCLPHDEEICKEWCKRIEDAERRVKKLVKRSTNAALIQDFDDIKARIEADRLLALRLQEEEREQFTIEERAKFLHDTIVAQRRFLAEQRAVAIRNRPPTRTQLRSQMMTYLKHVGNKKHLDLKNKTFEEIQALYEKVKRFDESFTVIGSNEDERKIKELNEGASDPDKKKKFVKEDVLTKVPAKPDVAEQGTKKRKDGHMKMLARKRKRPQSDVDSDDEHRKGLKIVTFEGTIDSEIMERKSVITRLNKVSSPDGDYLVIYRANGNFRAFNYLLENVAFVSKNTSSTNDFSTTYGVSNPSGLNSQYEQTSSYSLLANQSSCSQLDHEDLDQLDEFDLEEMDLKWQGILLECRTNGNQDSRRRDAWNSGNKDGRRSGKQEDSKDLVTIDGEGVDWTSHLEEEEDYALMACNSSGLDTKVTSCSKECKESYAKLKKLYDAQREQLRDASIEIQAYTQALKKVEA